jgi:hypothetical protein
MLKALCIAFLRLNGAEALPVPEEVQHLIETRLREQWMKGAESRPELRFDDPQCEEQGVYAYGSDNLVLNADVPSWRGRLELRLTDLLDGARIPFERVTPLAHRLPTRESWALAPNENAPPRWLPWVAGAGAVIAGVVAWRLRRPESEPRPTRSRPTEWSVTY